MVRSHQSSRSPRKSPNAPVRSESVRHVHPTHDGPVIDPVWELYRLAQRLTGRAATLLEWDANIPTFPEVHAEVLKAKRYLAGQAVPPAPTAPDSRPAVRAGAPNPIAHMIPEVA